MSCTAADRSSGKRVLGFPGSGQQGVSGTRHVKLHLGGSASANETTTVSGADPSNTDGVIPSVSANDLPSKPENGYGEH